ncbi:DNA methyltransferase [Metamycoplasma hyosynoviae]|uniref:DNA-methyltransferase n=1 Tax=Metamycoplasma hyosynoviae TaxID=29559 RepID=UPI0023610221|nr:DNA methyltransferase [Metamycoplasma hyosynoviae]MDD1378330.1 DNA methyltransferase [Metamycoplasma hyosynoviae]
MNFVIKNLDCLEYIKELKNKYNKPIFDAIITDPPYNISKKNNFETIGRKGIDFGLWDYGFDQITWIKEASTLLKNGGSIIIFNDWKNFGEIARTLEELNFEIKDLIRWIKNNPMPRNIDRRYVTDYELAIWAVKGEEKWTFNRPSNSKYQRPEFVYPIVPKSENKIHPTQKNVSLLEQLIKIHTNKNDLIFDPFMGSGSTCIAALKEGRRFMGCEISKEYFEKAERRINRFWMSNFGNFIEVNRSPLYYLGDKYKLIPQIASNFPEKIETFYDVFAGGGGLYYLILMQIILLQMILIHM